MESEGDDALLRLHGRPGVIPDPKRGLPGIVPVSRSTWWAWVANKTAPQPVRVGRCTFWRARDVREFAASAR